MLSAVVILTYRNIVPVVDKIFLIWQILFPLVYIFVAGYAYSSLINENEIVAIDFWAAWCAPCKTFGKIYEAVSNHFPAIKFAKINIEEEPELANAFNVRSIPHLVIIKEGIAIYSDSGSLPQSTLKELLEKAIDTDMTEIKSRLEAGE